jgi:hypothetical protein
MAQHTPSPWLAETNEKAATVTILGKRHDDNIRSSDGRGEIVTVQCASWLDDGPFAAMQHEDQANARLIAAAPELLEALDLLVAEIKDLDFVVNDSITSGKVDDALAAIAKATEAR